MCPVQGHNAQGSNSWPLGLESSTLPLSHCAPTSFLCDIDKQCRPRSDATSMPQNVASDQDLHCLLSECYENLNKNKKYNLRTLKTGMDWSNWYQWEIPFGFNGLKDREQPLEMYKIWNVFNSARVKFFVHFLTWKCSRLCLLYTTTW